MLQYLNHLLDLVHFQQWFRMLWKLYICKQQLWIYTVYMYSFIYVFVDSLSKILLCFRYCATLGIKCKSDTEIGHEAHTSGVGNRRVSTFLCLNCKHLTEGTKIREKLILTGSGVTKSDTWIHVVHAKNEEWSFLARKTTYSKAREGVLGEKQGNCG